MSGITCIACRQSVITNNVQTLAPALMLDFTRHLAFNCCQIELLFYNTADKRLARHRSDNLIGKQIALCGQSLFEVIVKFFMPLQCHSMFSEYVYDN